MDISVCVITALLKDGGRVIFYFLNASAIKDALKSEEVLLRRKYLRWSR